ncbi:MAG: CUB domain-containing protein, partial [bacterium]
LSGAGSQSFTTPAPSVSTPGPIVTATPIATSLSTPAPIATASGSSSSGLTSACSGSASLASSSGTISDGPANYASNMQCSWLIQAGSAVTLTFSAFATEG